MTKTMYTKIMPEESIETLRRQAILEETNRAHAALRANPERWGDVQAERVDWETALADGLEEDVIPLPFQPHTT